MQAPPTMSTVSLNDLFCVLRLMLPDCQQINLPHAQCWLEVTESQSIFATSLLAIISVSLLPVFFIIHLYLELWSCQRTQTLIWTTYIEVLAWLFDLLFRLGQFTLLWHCSITFPAFLPFLLPFSGNPRSSSHTGLISREHLSGTVR